MYNPPLNIISTSWGCHIVHKTLLSSATWGLLISDVFEKVLALGSTKMISYRALIYEYYWWVELLLCGFLNNLFFNWLIFRN